MNNHRITQLFKLLQEMPNDPFLLYGIALEYVSQDANEKANDYYERLLEDHANYLPTYYHATINYIALKNYIKAKDVIQKGITLAKELKENKAINELKNLAEELEDL